MCVFACVGRKGAVRYGLRAAVCKGIFQRESRDEPDTESVNESDALVVFVVSVFAGTPNTMLESFEREFKICDMNEKRALSDTNAMKNK